MHHTRKARFGHCDPILVLAILGANIFPSGLMSIMWFFACFVHLAQSRNHGKTRRQNELDLCGHQMTIFLYVHIETPVPPSQTIDCPHHF